MQPRGWTHILAVALATASFVIPTSVHAARASTPAVEDDGDEALVQRVTEILNQAGPRGRGRRASIARKLARLGPGAADAMLEVLADGRRLGAAQQEALIGAFALLGKEQIRPCLRRRVEDSPEASMRVAVLRVLEECGSHRDLPLLFDAALFEDAESRTRRSLAVALEKALTAIFQRDTASFAWLQRTWSEVHPALAMNVLRATGASGESRGLDLLLYLLRRGSAAKSVLYVEIARLAPVAPRHLERALIDTLRGGLEVADDNARKTSILALARLGDTGCIERLIELLGEDRPALRQNLLWGLRELTALSLGSDPARWSSWYQEELRWWEREAPAILRALHSPQLQEVVAAVQQTVRHRLFRHELAEELTTLLSHSSPTVRAMACQALGQLGSTKALPALVDALSDEAPEVSRGAWNALKVATGRNLPPEPMAWRQALRRRG